MRTSDERDFAIIKEKVEVLAGGRGSADQRAVRADEITSILARLKSLETEVADLRKQIQQANSG